MTGRFTNGGGMTIDRALVFSILMYGAAAGYAGPAMAQACARQGIDVACDDGRRGILLAMRSSGPTARDRA